MLLAVLLVEDCVRWLTFAVTNLSSFLNGLSTKLLRSEPSVVSDKLGNELGNIFVCGTNVE